MGNCWAAMRKRKRDASGSDDSNENNNKKKIDEDNNKKNVVSDTEQEDDLVAHPLIRRQGPRRIFPLRKQRQTAPSVALSSLHHTTGHPTLLLCDAFLRVFSNFSKYFSLTSR